MRPESILLIVTLLGAVVGALSHGLQLVDRYQNWRARQRDGLQPAAMGIRARSTVTIAAILLSGAAGAAAVAFWAMRDVPVAPVASGGRLALPDGPSVTVLPFKSLGDAADANVIAEGLTQNITTALSAIPGLFVIAEYSAAVYRGNDAEFARIGREQGVRNILSGAVQRGTGNKLRVTVHLNDAATGHELWSTRFDRSDSDLFELQDEIAMNVAANLQVRLTDGEQARFRRKGTRNFESWRLATQGFAAFQRYDAAANAQARRLAEEALRLDPDYPWAWSILASARLIAARFGYAEDPEAMSENARLAALKSIELDPLQAMPYGVMGAYHLVHREFEAAESMGRRALQLEPSSAEIRALLAQTLFFRGKWQEAVTLSREAVRLSPVHPSWYLIWQIWGNVYLGDTPAALTGAKRMVEIAESPLQRAVAYDSTAFAQVESGQLANARGSIASALQAMPGHSLGFHRLTMHFEDSAQFERFAAAMRRAGLPE